MFLVVLEIEIFPVTTCCLPGVDRIDPIPLCHVFGVRLSEAPPVLVPFVAGALCNAIYLIWVDLGAFPTDACLFEVAHP